MRHLLLGAVAASAMIMGAAQASAADVDYVAPPETGGVYAGIFAGVTFPSDIKGQYYGSTDLEIDADTGFIVGGVLGTSITPNLRGEFELSYAQNDVDDECLVANSFGGWCDDDNDSIDGDLGTLFLLGNVWYDFHFAGISPYIGGGVGAAIVMPDLTLYDDDDYEWSENRLSAAGQLGVGFIWGFSDNMALDIGYRAKAVLGGTFSDGDACENACSAEDITYVLHTVQLGLTFGF